MHYCIVYFRTDEGIAFRSYNKSKVNSNDIISSVDEIVSVEESYNSPKAMKRQMQKIKKYKDKQPLPEEEIKKDLDSILYR